jgi:hypothetical protein
MLNCCYLNKPNTDDHLRIRCIQHCDDDCLIIVPRDHFPCLAFFDKDGNLLLCHPEREYNEGFVTCLARHDFWKEEEQRFSNYDPIDDFSHDSFIVILSKEKLEEMGFQVETREGWRWDYETFRSIEIECPDKTQKAWCPATQNWEKPCDCAECKKTSHTKYVNHSVIKDLYRSLPDYLQRPHDIGNPLAEFANKCLFDEVNYCYKCGGCFACEKECVRYDPHS